MKATTIPRYHRAMTHQYSTTRSTPPLIVGISGLRGLVNVNFSLDDAERYTRAIAAWLWVRFDAMENKDGTCPRVVVSRDGRANGKDIYERVWSTLAACGCRVLCLDVAPTPTTGVLVDSHRAHAGVIITASHNPGQWNGIKCLVSDASGSVCANAPNAAQAQQIVERFNCVEQMIDRCGGSVYTTTESDALYHPRLVLKQSQAQNNPARITCVLDSVNASGWPVAKHLLASLQCDVIQTAGDSSGIFPHEPEPTKENLADLCTQVVAHNADIGFAQDPDADRLAIIDENGVYIGEEYTLALCALEVLTSMPADRAHDAVLCTNLSTSRMIEDIAASFGARVVRTAVGEANVVQAMKHHNAAIGGEGNGGVIWPRVTYVRDSLSAMALVVSLMRRNSKTLSQLVASIPSYAIVKRKQSLTRKSDAQPAIDSLTAHWQHQPNARIDTQDGVRIDVILDDGSDAWVHVRASNTEPILRLIAEARSEQQADRLLDEVAAQISG